VLADVTQEMPAWTDEIFGPVAPVTTFRTDEEALALANNSEYGLVGAVYSRSLSRGLALAQRIRAGMVHVNDGTLNDEATIPFGGTGLSGNGTRYGGEANLDNFTEWQWVTVRDEPPTFPF
jgi:benzaldehyde dehydrogenase (NAD)